MERDELCVLQMNFRLRDGVIITYAFMIIFNKLSVLHTHGILFKTQELSGMEYIVQGGNTNCQIRIYYLVIKS